MQTTTTSPSLRRLRALAITEHNLSGTGLQMLRRRSLLPRRWVAQAPNVSRRVSSSFSTSSPIADDDDDNSFLKAHAPRAIDVHSHMYPPASYMKLLRSRAEVPRVVSVGGEDRLIILPGEDEESTTAAGVRVWTGRWRWLGLCSFAYDRRSIKTHLTIKSLHTEAHWRRVLERRPQAPVHGACFRYMCRCTHTTH